MRATIFEGVQRTLETDDGDIIAVHVGIKPLAASDCRSIADIHPAQPFAHIIPVCSRAASDIID
jgi:hypothetical protein